jgi:hypothetical protein
MSTLQSVLFGHADWVRFEIGRDGPLGRPRRARRSRPTF